MPHLLQFGDLQRLAPCLAKLHQRRPGEARRHANPKAPGDQLQKREAAVSVEDVQPVLQEFWNI